MGGRGTSSGGNSKEYKGIAIQRSGGRQRWKATIDGETYGFNTPSEARRYIDAVTRAGNEANRERIRSANNAPELRTVKAKLSPAQERLMGDILREYDDIWSPSRNPETRISPYGKLRSGTIWSTVTGASPRSYDALERMGFIEIVNSSGTFPVVKVLARPEK